ncbi:hypothetical protein HanRHA438_Chr01g0041921 [Helianthus annuus]|uniref:Uncharacterized protein n=1 Tax=Helianthus annuus TaxID=4232 RepID=A0A251VRY4_HELAN|nr:hypothetical protein HanXRQr2_Chr01g0041041 [Helianthus annuus]KAJ0628384.1 hypothetical protein HanHA89_Chr01g0035991 [Helianthus annuus]KAJ0784653.1 hypothetical protein HanLR1_Chr01g0034311 [Helianthus annuus]KAJ0949743.1 hypothetical protein HanRHA438_Chr01g0041921 [Helianthus annuus]KAJ0958517.1 hypothetical protein HanPSC8_Chr01g0039841 [Helianthus annuus]
MSFHDCRVFFWHLEILLECFFFFFLNPEQTFFFHVYDYFLICKYIVILGNHFKTFNFLLCSINSHIRVLYVCSYFFFLNRDVKICFIICSL